MELLEPEVSDSKLVNFLKLQWHNNLKKLKYLVADEAKQEEDILKIIEENSNNELSNKNTIILLIYSDKPLSSDESLKEITKDACQKSWFESIYYIELPDEDARKLTSPENKWNVLKLK